MNKKTMERIVSPLEHPNQTVESLRYQFVIVRNTEQFWLHWRDAGLTPATWSFFCQVGTTPYTVA